MGHFISNFIRQVVSHIYIASFHDSLIQSFSEDILQKSAVVAGAILRRRDGRCGRI